MINKLVEEVNNIKKDQGVKIDNLISSVDETNKQFRQMKKSVDQGVKIDKLISSVSETCKQVKLPKGKVETDLLNGQTSEDIPVSKVVKELLLCPIV